VRKEVIMMKELDNIKQLNERREVLEKELKDIVTEIVLYNLKNELQKPLSDAGIEVTSIEWDFYPESDDEGGSIYYPSGLEINTVDNKDLEGVTIKEVYYGDEYDTDVDEFIREKLSYYSSDLYDYDIYEIVFKEED